MPQQDASRQILDNVYCSILEKFPRNVARNPQDQTGPNLAPGVYRAKKRLYEYQFALVKSSGHIYVCSFPSASLGTTSHDLWPDISLYQPLSKTLTIEKIKGSEIVKILPEEEFRRVTQPRPFSVCLVGDYGGGWMGDDCGVGEPHGLRYQNFYREHIKIFPDGSVHCTPWHSRRVEALREIDPPQSQVSCKWSPSVALTSGP